MSQLIEQIEADIIKAAKDKNEVVLMVLRAVKNSFHNLSIQQKDKAGELGDGDVVKILRSEMKKRQEAALLYKQGGRAELEQKEVEEMKVLEKYLPVAPSTEAIIEVINKLKIELGASTIKDMGRLTKAVMESFGGAADGKQVSTLVKEVLSS